jgi:hypothetical protein
LYEIVIGDKFRELFIVLAQCNKSIFLSVIAEASSVVIEDALFNGMYTVECFTPSCADCLEILRASTSWSPKRLPGPVIE